MNFHKKHLAQESLGGESPLDSISNVEAPETNLDTQLTELASEDQAMDELDKDGATLDGDMARTEDAITLGENAEEAGEEISAVAANAIEVGQESIRNRWGINRRAVATENFGRRGGTRMATESWSSTLKDLWERFVAFIRERINKLKDLKLKVMNAGKSAVARAEKFEKALQNLGGEKKKDEIGGSFIGQLSLENEFKPTDCADIAKSLVAGGKTAAALAAVNTALESATAYTLSSKDGDVTIKSGETKVELPGKNASKLRILPPVEGQDNATPHAVKALPGNAYAQTASVGEGENALFYLAYYNDTDKGDTTEVPTPSSGEMRGMVNDLRTIGKNYESVLKDFRKYEDTMAKLEKAAAKIVANFNKSKEDDREHLRTARTAATLALSGATAMNKIVHTSVRTVLSGISGYVGAGIAAYGKAK